LRFKGEKKSRGRAKGKRGYFLSGGRNWARKLGGKGIEEACNYHCNKCFGGVSNSQELSHQKREYEEEGIQCTKKKPVIPCLGQGERESLYNPDDSSGQEWKREKKNKEGTRGRSRRGAGPGDPGSRSREKR